MPIRSLPGSFPTRLWDVFCDVIDNYGDVGVCWRLAVNLAQRGQRVRLWVSDVRPLQWMAPNGHPGVEVRHWQAPLTDADLPAEPADVLIEAQRAEAQAMGLNETGGFINSIKATDVKGDDTEKYVEIYPQGRAKHGNDRKGDKSKVRYATIGFVAEYGTSSRAARPYMTVANEKAHEKVVEAQRSIWESETGE